MVSFHAIIMGPQGSGKGTYATRIAPMFDAKVISTGDLIRAEIAKKSEIGKKIEGICLKGMLVPDEIVLDLLKRELADTENFILDGFPRTIAQAITLENIADIDVVINLIVPKPVLIQRLSSRRVCQKCGAIFNILTLKPKKEGVCDKCQGTLIQRADDNPEAIEQRLKLFQEQTAPIIDFYRKKGIVIDIECNSADIPPEIMVDRILKMLADRGIKP